MAETAQEFYDELHKTRLNVQYCAYRRYSQDQSLLEECHRPATHGELCEYHNRKQHHHHDGRGQ